MRILPVIDIQNGVVVRGVAGNRESYRPVESRWAKSASVADVGRGLVERYGFGEVYVADLDAIAGREPNWAHYQQLADLGLQLDLDAGLQSPAQATSLAKFAAGANHRLIAGLESLSELPLLAQFAAIAGPQRLIFSLDMKAGKLLSGNPDIAAREPWDVAAEALGYDIGGIILLDLAQVGTGGGTGTGTLCTQLRDTDADLTIITGGGIRTLDDLRQQERLGASAVLVASGLHNGTFEPEDVAEWR